MERTPQAPRQRDGQTRRKQLRQPRLAEMVADVLRERIVSGDLQDGALLPKQDEILEEFRVSKPSAREAFRILETEGLVTVQRGNVGGAVVHLPKPDTVAYMLALVLEARRVTLEDAALALRHVEPICAALCAAREDRADTVVPRLEAAHQRLVQALDDGDEQEVTVASRTFHEELVASCANETMIIVAGTLETLWSAHERSWSVLAAEAGRFPEPKLRARAVREHQEIITMIAKGDVDGASRAARRHLTTAQLYPLSDDPASRVRASAMRAII